MVYKSLKPYTVINYARTPSHGRMSESFGTFTEAMNRFRYWVATWPLERVDMEHHGRVVCRWDIEGGFTNED